MKLARWVAVLAAPLLLNSCLLTPGKFVSTLDIKADRSFTFTYVGEAILIEPSISAAPDSVDESAADEDADTPKPDTPEMVAERRAVADALAREQGYRAAEYLGGGRFRVDYAMSGRLDRNFLYPFNSDAEAIFPWVAIELRKDGTARIKAPAFGDGEAGPNAGPLNPLNDAAKHREGSFTLTTDAELVMHNNEQGMAPGQGKTVVWTVAPTSKTVPTAVVRFAD